MGSLVAPDDLSIGFDYTVHSTKDGRLLPICGYAFRCIAINLPYVIGKMACDSEVITFDIRVLNVIKVNHDYVRAQSNCTKGVA